MKSGNLNFLEPSRPLQAFKGIAFSNFGVLQHKIAKYGIIPKNIRNICVNTVVYLDIQWEHKQ